MLKKSIGLISALKDTGSHRNLQTGPHQFSTFFLSLNKSPIKGDGVSTLPCLHPGFLIFCYTCTANIYSGNVTQVKSVHLTSICHIQSNVQVTVKKTVNQIYIYSTVLGAAIKCKQYSEITVESGTHVKIVEITLNIFAVH